MIGYSDHGDFNPIIVLFLTESTSIQIIESESFQSYYSLISNFIKQL